MKAPFCPRKPWVAARGLQIQHGEAEGSQGLRLVREHQRVGWWRHLFIVGIETMSSRSRSKNNRSREFMQETTDDL